MPAERHSWRSRSEALAVMATMGVVHPNWRMAYRAGSEKERGQGRVVSRWERQAEEREKSRE